MRAPAQRRLSTLVVESRGPPCQSCQNRCIGPRAYPRLIHPATYTPSSNTGEPPGPGGGMASSHRRISQQPSASSTGDIDLYTARSARRCTATTVLPLRRSLDRTAFADTRWPSGDRKYHRLAVKVLARSSTWKSPSRNRPPRRTRKGMNSQMVVLVGIKIAVKCQPDCLRRTISYVLSSTTTRATAPSSEASTRAITAPSHRSTPSSS